MTIGCLYYVLSTLSAWLQLLYFIEQVISRILLRFYSYFQCTHILLYYSQTDSMSELIESIYQLSYSQTDRISYHIVGINLFCYSQTDRMSELIESIYQLCHSQTDRISYLIVGINLLCYSQTDRISELFLIVVLLTDRRNL